MQVLVPDNELGSMPSNTKGHVSRQCESVHGFYIPSLCALHSRRSLLRATSRYFALLRATSRYFTLLRATTYYTPTTNYTSTPLHGVERTFVRGADAGEEPEHADPRR